MSRILLACALAASITACADAPLAPESAVAGPNAAVVRYERSFRMFRTACNGELVTLAGMTDVTELQQDRVLNVVMRSEGLGVGQTSAYRISWMKTFQFVAGEATHQSATELLRLQGDASTPDTFIRGIAVATVNPDGTVVVDIDFSDEACHGA